MYKYLSIAVLAFVVYLLSCNNGGGTSNSPTQSEKLPATLYAINTTRDTLLKTTKGAMLFIPQGALQGATPTVQLSVREAYSMADIVLAGLVTVSGGKPLSSGGMIEIKPGDSTVKIVKPIKVSLPTDFYRKEMQVFKGNKLPDGSIDWVEPKPITTDTGSKIACGEKLFTQNCASCHAPDKDVTGPPITFSFQRQGKNRVKQFTRNPAAMIKKDAYAKALFCRWGPTVMAPFPSLTDADFDCLEAYLNNESKKIDPATVPDLRKSVDSCQAYLKAQKQIAKKIEQINALMAKKQELINDNGPQVVYKKESQSAVSVNVTVLPGNTVIPTQNKAVYYQFTVEQFGWYNVDIFTKDIPGFQPAELMVTIAGTYKNDLNIYLVIPGEKIFVPGGLLKDKKDTYGFFTNDGKLPLPLGKPAYIISFGEAGGGIIYGAQQFIIQPQNQLSISPGKMSKTEFNAAVKKLDIKDLPITVTDSKNSTEIKKLDSTIQQLDDRGALQAMEHELEHLRPKNFPCPDCLILIESDGITVK